MTTLLLAFTLIATPAEPAAFTATGTGDETPTGTLTAISLSLGAQVNQPNGPKTVKGLVSLRRPEKPVPALPTGAQLITAGGDRIPGSVNGGDAKVVKFRPTLASEDWPIGLDVVAAIWIVAPTADTPADSSGYTWLAGTPSRDVLLFRNGDTVRGSLGGFTATGVKFTPDGGAAREVTLNDLAAVGFNPRFARVRKPKGPYAHLVLADGSRLDVSEAAVKENTLVVKAICGPAVELPLSKLIALDVLQGSAVYLSDLKPKKAETAGFLGAGWPWVADRNVRGQPLRLFANDSESTADKGLGTHPKTILTYDLSGKYARFESLVGLDVVTGKRGRADVRILLDGKEVPLPELKTLVAGPAVAVRVDVRGAKELTLVVDFGPTGDVQADVNWGDARLIWRVVKSEKRRSARVEEQRVLALLYFSFHTFVREALSLRELRTATGAAETVLLAFLHPGIAGEEAGVAELLHHARSGSAGCAGAAGAAGDQRLAVVDRSRAGGTGLRRDRLGLFALAFLVAVSLDDGGGVENLRPLLVLRAEHRLDGAGQALRHSPGLTGHAAALRVDKHIEPVQLIGHLQWPDHCGAVLIFVEVLVKRLAVDEDLPLALGDANAGNGGLPPARSEVIGAGSLRGGLLLGIGHLCVGVRK